MSGSQSGTSSTPQNRLGLSVTTDAGRRGKLMGTTDMETVCEGSPAENQDLLAALRSEGEIVSTDERVEREDRGSDEPDENIEVGDGPDDEDDLPALLQSPDDVTLEDDGVREILSFENGSQGETWPDTVFTISFSNDGAQFIPPRWITETRGVATSHEARVLMYSIARHVRFFAVLAEWFATYRPRFVSTFGLRYWAPDSVADVEALYAKAGPNCLQKSMVRLLSQADTSLRISESTMSRYLGKTILVHKGCHTMPLAGLFSSQAQAIWAASAILCFMREHKLMDSALDMAAENLARDKIRPAAERAGVDTRAMRLQDFILYVQKPLSRTVSISAAVIETKKLLSEEPLSAKSQN